MIESLEITGHRETEPHIKLVAEERLQELVEQWQEEDQFEEENFPKEKVQALKNASHRKATVVSPKDPVHDHPDPELIVLEPSAMVRILFLTESEVGRKKRKTVTFRNRAPERQIVEIRPHEAHLIALMKGHLRILTTKRNKEGNHYPSFAAYLEQQKV